MLSQTSSNIITPFSIDIGPCDGEEYYNLEIIIASKMFPAAYLWSCKKKLHLQLYLCTTRLCTSPSTMESKIQATEMRVLRLIKVVTYCEMIEDCIVGLSHVLIRLVSCFVL